MGLYDQKERCDNVNIFNITLVNKFHMFYGKISERVMISHF